MASIPQHDLAPVLLGAKHLFAATTRNGIAVDLSAVGAPFTTLERSVSGGRIHPRYNVSALAIPAGFLDKARSANVTSLARKYPAALVAEAGNGLVELSAPRLMASALAHLSSDAHLRALLAQQGSGIDPFGWLTKQLTTLVAGHDAKVAFFAWLWNSTGFIEQSARDEAACRAARNELRTLFGRAETWLTAYSANLPEHAQSAARRDRVRHLGRHAGLIWQGLISQIAAQLPDSARPVLLTADSIVVEAPEAEAADVAKAMRTATADFLAIELPDVATRIDVDFGPHLDDMRPAA